MAKKSRVGSDLQRENLALRQQVISVKHSRAGDYITRVFQTLARCAVVVIVAYLAEETITAFAGKDTKADINADVKADFFGYFHTELLDIDTLCWTAIGMLALVAVLSVVWAWCERQLRKRALQHLHPTRLEKELALDPQRTSSQITSRGETNPEDK